MAQSGIISLPRLAGVLAEVGPWRGLVAHSGWLIRPYQTGARVRLSSTGTTAYLHGLGTFANNDYVMRGVQTAYGDGYFFVPYPGQLSRVSAVSGTEDELTLTTVLTLNEGDWLFNLGVDTLSSLAESPNYDGSTLSLYTDPVGTNTAGTYLVTGSKGQYEGYLESGTLICDLLICDASGTPRLISPLIAPGPEVLP